MVLHGLRLLNFASVGALHLDVVGESTTGSVECIDCHFEVSQKSTSSISGVIVCHNRVDFHVQRGSIAIDPSMFNTTAPYFASFHSGATAAPPSLFFLLISQ